MSSVTNGGGAKAPFFSKEATYAQPGFSRWMVPPAALAVHLCIGQAYAFSVFNAPLSKVIGITESVADDWKLTTLGWIFSLAIFFLGISAAFAGKWLERVGPRRTMFTAACCFGGGFLISALGVYTHQIALLYLGYGVLGGIGLGLGYVSPVSTLIRWFPDRRGMATGMAIMGFGGGAMIAAPLSVVLMNHFKSATSVGVAQTFLVMGVGYFISMSIGSLAIRVPPPGWKPEGWTPPVVENKMITRNHVHIDEALKTPQFYLLWFVLFLNVTAGIGVLGQASLMIQESFKGSVTAARSRLRRPAVAVQHGRPLLLGFLVGLDRPQEHVLHFLRAGCRAVLAGAATGRRRQYRAVRAGLLRDHVDVRRWLLHHPGLPGRHVRHGIRGRYPRPPADRLGRCRYRRPRAGQLHPRVPGSPRRDRRRRLHHDTAHHGRPAGDRLHLQPDGVACQ